jgi:ABC-type Fe3+/spermidine/putrescine transport system ATPase subunit
MDALEIREVSCRLGTSEVLRSVSLSLGPREVVALLGPSGSGKTTLLRVVGGFETRYTGSVVWEGRALEGVPPERRRFGTVFQHYALFPHLSVGENVAYGLHGRPRAEVKERVRDVLALVELEGFEDRRISELSGGQQQRVALARALAPEPRLLLLDEPLSNLDPQLRERTRGELRRLLDSLGIPTLWITHEQEEAFELGDRVAVLRAGHLEQVGTAQELYRQPRTRFVAGFLGRMSWVRGILSKGSGDRPVARTATGWELPVSVPGNAAIGLEVEVGLRPERLVWQARNGPPEPGSFVGRVARVRFLGAWSYLEVEMPGEGTLEVLTGQDPPAPGESIGVRLLPGPELPAFPISGGAG